MSRGFLLLGLLMVLGSGCATARPTGHKGLLESPTPSRSFARLGNGGATASRPSRPGAVEMSGGSGALGWPLSQVQITSPFGKRGKDFHEGIDLKASHGTAVLAAQDGTVLYAGSRIRGYGKMIVIRHARQISTIYAHNSRLLVRIGQNVRRGQKIALSGKTGHATGPHLHFEVRDGMAALNPMELLPSRQLSAISAPPAVVSAQPPKAMVAASTRGRRASTAVAR